MESSTKPKISVIIPAFNRAHCILNAVESALTQTLSPLEVLVIDDGSVDGTSELFENTSSMVRYLTKVNGGVSSARNYGLKHAKGDWIAFLDSDDVWLPEKLTLQWKAMEALNSSACFTAIETEDGIFNLKVGHLNYGYCWN